jgi:hypothetical protein
MPRKPHLCRFEDSNHHCWKPWQSRGVCAAPGDGTASALVQHADQRELCQHHPPHGFRALCREHGAQQTLRMLRTLRDPAVCHYRSCAVVGSGGGLLGARQGAEIDAHDAVIRLNFAPDAEMTAQSRTAPHSHLPTWKADVGSRTTWRVMAMEGFGYLSHYGRFWLRPPHGHGKHENMSGIPQEPLLAIGCHTPGRGTGRCRAERLAQTFAHPWSASYLINPLLLKQWSDAHFRGVRHQQVLSTGMYAIAFASQLCGKTHIYGFGNGSCPHQCYHYYDCGETAGKQGVEQATMFGDDPKATGGYHNFTAQATVLRRLSRSGAVVANWGSCSPGAANPPAEAVNRKRARRSSRSKPNKARRRGKRRGSGVGVT